MATFSGDVQLIPKSWDIYQSLTLIGLDLALEPTPSVLGIQGALFGESTAVAGHARAIVHLQPRTSPDSDVASYGLVTENHHLIAI